MDGHTAAFEGRAGGLSGIDAQQLSELKPTFERIARIALADSGLAHSDVIIMAPDGSLHGMKPELIPQLPKDQTFTGMAMLAEDILWIEDALEDDRFRDHPLVVGKEGFRFGAGAPNRLEDGQVIGALVVASPSPRPYDQALARSLNDLAAITADQCSRQRALDDLARASEDAANALDSARRAQMRLDMALNIGQLRVWEMDWKRKTLKGYGYTDPDQKLDPTFGELNADMFAGIHPDDRDAAAQAWINYMKDGTPFRQTYRLAKPDGGYNWVSSVVEAIRDPKGRIVRILGVLRNITPEKVAELELVKARDEAEAANRAKSEFLANMSHEIRTPLNGVMGIAGALARTELSSGQAEMVQLIETSAQTLEALLTDILDLARIEAGRLEIRPEPFELSTSINACAALFQAAAEAKGLKLVVNIDPGAEGTFQGDAPRIRQILSNLIGNAVKFTSEGEIRISVGAYRDETTSRLSFAVSDTGIGFDEDTKQRLFNRFQQADGSITRKYGGTGLGLAISRTLAEAMGGELTAQSLPGQGSTFCFDLELPRRHGAIDLWDFDDTPISEAQLPELDTMRVLLAEDHPTNRRVVQLILEAAGVDLICVENGAEALDEARRGPFDLILMDMQMPVMDGLTAIRAIRRWEQKEGHPPMPIHTLTANAMPEHAQASHAAGANGHVTKPITAEGLLKVVEQVWTDRMTARQQALSA